MNDLDQLLRDDASVALPDDGFSARVMQALPARAARSRPWLRPALVLGSAAIGSALALALSPGEVSLVQGFVDLASLRGLTPAAVVGVGMAGALLLSAVVLAADPD